MSSSTSSSRWPARPKLPLSVLDSQTVPVLLTVDETAAALGVSPHTLTNWRRPGYVGAPDLPFIRVGNGVRYYAADVRAFLDRQRWGGGDGR